MLTRAAHSEEQKIRTSQQCRKATHYASATEAIQKSICDIVVQQTLKCAAVCGRVEDANITDHAAGATLRCKRRPTHWAARPAGSGKLTCPSSTCIHLLQSRTTGSHLLTQHSTTKHGSVHGFAHSSSQMNYAGTDTQRTHTYDMVCRMRKHDAAVFSSSRACAAV